MATAGATPPRLTDDQLSDIMALVGGSDSVELKLSINDADRRATIDALGLDPLQCQIRQVFFFDTPDLKLSKSGVVVRARRVQGRGDDSTVKLRPIRPEDLTPELRATPGFKVEVDAMPGSVRLLGLDERGPGQGRCPSRRGEGPSHPQAVLEGAAGVLRRACARRDRPGRPLDPRPDLRAQDQVHARAIRSPDGRRVLAVPRRPPRCSSCRRSACRPRPSRRPPKPGHRCCGTASRPRASRTPRPARPSTSTRRLLAEAPRPRRPPPHDGGDRRSSRARRPSPSGARRSPARSPRSRGRESPRDDGGPTSSPGSPGPRRPLAAHRPGPTSTPG